MRSNILVIHEQRSVADALLRAFADGGFSATAVQTLDEALDYFCAGGHAKVIFYDGSQSGVAWAFRRAQDANPALLDRLMIALAPLTILAPGTRPGAHGPIDVSALLLIVRQFSGAAASPLRSEAEPR